MSESRNLAEAVLVFGDRIVTQGLQNPRAVEADVKRDPGGVRFDVMTLYSFLPEHLDDAIAWARRLSEQRQATIAGLWCGNPAVSYLMAENGLFRRVNDA